MTELDRRAARAELRRADLVRAAYDLVVSRGFRTIGVDDIARAAGVSHGTFYNYFHNKRDILDAVIDHCFAHIRARLLGPEGDDRPHTLAAFCDRYARVVDRCYDLVEQEPGLVNFLLLEASSIDEHVIERCMRNARDFARQAVQQVDSGISLGFLDATIDADISGEVLLSVLVSALFSALRAGADGLSQDRVRAQLTDFLATALGVPA
ncbi:TetR/AcrR family transcriptional regulator [Nocardia jejuensis]|uniref:TetR/AcrR family transcriptional regulator n=1 Tax=Nocardia jejuensis TaxID=328049 RepID=UPI00083690BD|nr:TetR/AcrR family transcriptional regulator [Nocardia jejuensis]